ncbi:5046_t:CDS:2, partial [Gigaspora margarita]
SCKNGRHSIFEEENICDIDIASNVDDNTSQYETNDNELEEELQINFKIMTFVIPALDTFLDTSSQSSECDNFCIIVYDAVHLDNEDQVSKSTDSIWYGK